MNQYQNGGYPPQGPNPQNGYGQPQGGYQPQQQKVYVGSGKVRQAPWGPVMRLSFSADDLAKLQAALNSRGWVSIDIKERSQPSQNGASHYGEIDFWEPQQQNGYQQPQQQGQYYQAPPQQQQYQQPPQQQGQYRQAPPPQQQRRVDDGGFGGQPPPQQQYQQPPQQQYQAPPQQQGQYQPPPPAPGSYAGDLPPQGQPYQAGPEEESIPF